MVRLVKGKQVLKLAGGTKALLRKNNNFPVFFYIFLVVFLVLALRKNTKNHQRVVGPRCEAMGAVGFVEDVQRRFGRRRAWCSARRDDRFVWRSELVEKWRGVFIGFSLGFHWIL